MKKLFKPELFKTLLFVLIVLLLVKIAYFVVELLFLPTTGVNQVDAKNIRGLYYRNIKLVNEKKEVIIIDTRPEPPKDTTTIKDITLMAIYNASDLTIVTVEYKKKSKVLSKGDIINGFMLESANSNSATFSKDSQTYQIFLTKIDTKGIRSTMASKPIVKKRVVHKKTTASGKIQKVGDRRIVDRSLVEHYAKNMKEIFKDIGIVEVKQGNSVSGFRVTFVRRGSKFAQLGLRRGDVLTAVNGQVLDNYSAALGIYKNIDTIENLTLVIKRGKEEMELEYEIN